LGIVRELRIIWIVGVDYGNNSNLRIKWPNPTNTAGLIATLTSIGDGN